MMRFGWPWLGMMACMILDASGGIDQRTIIEENDGQETVASEHTQLGTNGATTSQVLQVLIFAVKSRAPKTEPTAQQNGIKHRFLRFFWYPGCTRFRSILPRGQLVN